MNPATGAASITIPLPTSLGRSGFTPQLELTYDSGSGNSPFGLGWSLSLPSITRKTDKGLPRYDDDHESDVFILSGAEDLVPEYKKDTQGNLLHDPQGNFQVWEDSRVVSGVSYRVRRYRPRTEGLFARIERWVRSEDGDIHWRSISKDNVTTFYGKRETEPRGSPVESRIADPANPDRVFSWLICKSYDDKGNAVAYSYVADNTDNIDTSLVHETNRTPAARTANRYLKRVRYANSSSLAASGASAPPLGPDLSQMKWHFEVVFDYGEGHITSVSANNAKGELIQVSPAGTRLWPTRADAFSRYRSGFEIRTYRRCQRILVFHHFENELPTPNYLVRSLDLAFLETPITSYLKSATRSGYVLQADGNYLRKTLPPVEFEFSRSPLEDFQGDDFLLRDLDPPSLENVPAGATEGQYQWVDLDGEGISGLLTEQAAAWYFKPNLGSGRLGGLRAVNPLPSLRSLANSQQQLLDLDGDGLLDLVEFGEPGAGYYERSEDRGWEPFRSFRRSPNLNWRNPNLRFTDLSGDGLADVLITEGDELTWYESLAEEGFDAGVTLKLPHDENQSPRVLFADPDRAVLLADMSGDGLSDLVRISRGEVCYWPNVGYGRFGPKIAMDNSPWFDFDDQFDPRRIHLADTDGSGVADLIYHGRNGADIYLNHAGNGWSKVRQLGSVPSAHHLSALHTVDLLGAGTICLVWSSSLPGDTRRSMKYIDLMKGQKPHLLVRSENNLGAETRIGYTSSTQFYLQDRADGKPWVTRLPFPVHVVTRVETFDRISRNRFVSRYTYHHGRFDGFEREFHGFGMVEQRDTEEYASLSVSDAFPTGDNMDEGSHVPPVVARTWFHTGAYLGRDRVSNHFANEYFREPRHLKDPPGAAKFLLADTVLPADMTTDEEREACRALRGRMMRQEVYALDGKGKDNYPLGYPYVVAEQNFTVERLQPKSNNKHGVFFTHPREAVTYHYERNPDHPRISHVMTLEVDRFGNVLKSVSIGYERRVPDGSLSPTDQKTQAKTHVTYSENGFTHPISENDTHRTPLTSENRTYELSGYGLQAGAERFGFGDFLRRGANGLELIFDSEIAYEDQPTGGKQRRLIEHVRSLYRSDDLSGPLPLGKMESLAIPFETYKLALTPGLLTKVFAGKVTTTMLASEGHYKQFAGETNWWVPSGRILYSPDRNHTEAEELHYARRHFFLQQRYRDPFHSDLIGTETVVRYDDYDLLVLETEDALGNRVTAGERDANPLPTITKRALDYRTLQPTMAMDPNRNRSFIAMDALGLVVGTAVAGKPGEMSTTNPTVEVGDSLTDFEPNLPENVITSHLSNPVGNPHEILGKATTRLIYDLFAYHRTKGQPTPSAPVVYSLVRETHESDLVAGQPTKVQHSFSYSDGFGREIQKKIQAEPGPAPKRDPTTGKIVVDDKRQPVMNAANSNPRWVGTGWTVFNNKEKPVRQFEPFFTDTHRFEFDVKIGVSSILFYDPPGRVVGTLHPNHTWEKVTFDAWKQETWDVNDTVRVDPKTDENLGGFFRRLPDTEYLPTWHAQRINGLLGPQEKEAAEKAAVHAGTKTSARLDSLGRTFSTVAHNRAQSSDSPKPPPDEFYRTGIVFDLEGNQREVIDAKDRVVTSYDYDMIGDRIHSRSMEAGERWMLNDVAGKALYAWDSRDHRLRTTYDRLRRPTEERLKKGANPEIVVEQAIYGEARPNPEVNNLRTRVVQRNDQAGKLLTPAFDFKGNQLTISRQLAQDYKSYSNWQRNVLLENEVYETRTQFDALNRLTEKKTPDGSVVRPVYNEANLLEKVEAVLAGDTSATVFVTNIDYDAKGRRTRIEYGNGVVTTYDFDPLTFRLKQLVTKRDPAKFPDDCKQPSPPGWKGCWLQDLNYTYDPVGNITVIIDNAQQTIFFRNKKIEPSAWYTYDAVYRLIEAIGREHIGQNGRPSEPDAFGYNHTQIAHPSDGNAMATYRENYVYDAVGNILQMQHRGGRPPALNWTRRYTYNEASQIDAANKSNRLSHTSVSGSNEVYRYNAHGSMTEMPHLPTMRYDHKDQLYLTSRKVDAGCEETYYISDFQGQRVRKITERRADVRKNERIYLDGFEIYRRYAGDGSTVTLARTTLHIMDDKKRIAMVERRTHGTDGQAKLIRYQFDNHLGSACIELDHEANVLSYEEYFPYGATSYQATRAGLDRNPKRYRYTGKERDEESGLYYHGARYYASWLGRWTAVDPKMKGFSGKEYKSELQTSDNEEEPIDDLKVRFANGYLFVFSNPIIHIDDDGKEPTQIGYVYVIKTTAKGEQVVYTGSARELRQRFSKHEWKELIKMERTTIEAHKITAELNVGASGRGSLLSARNEALRSAEQVVLKRQRAEMGLKELNKLEAATEENIVKWGERHNVKIGAKYTFKGGVKLGAFAGFQLLDIFLMYRESKMSQYVMAPYLLEDESGVFTLDIQDRGIFRSDRYFKNYQSGSLEGQKVEITKDEMNTLRDEAEALWGTTDWKGDWVPGLLRRELPVMDAPAYYPNFI